MANTLYGVRSYTCSEKTKRSQKGPVDQKKLEKRNSNQRRLYISLDNIDRIFSNNNDEFPVCYDMIFNTIQGKVTKYFKTRDYDRKKELSYDCINYLYSVLKRKLLRMKDQQGLLKPPPVLFFYLSQFFRYIELVVYSIVYFGTQDLKYIVQEPENFKTDDILTENSNYDDELLNSYIEHPEEDTYTLDDELRDNYKDEIKKCIETNESLNNKEKNILLKITRNCYSDFGYAPLTKKDTELLLSIQNRIKENPELLKDMQEILNGQR